VLQSISSASTWTNIWACFYYILLQWKGVFFLVTFFVELLVSFLYHVCLSDAAVKSVPGTKSVVDGFGFT